MTDNQIEHLIFTEISQRDITFYDMIGSNNIDPAPDDKTTMRHHRARPNRFSTSSSADRIIELLSTIKYNQYCDIPPLRVTLQDLFRFWWNCCVDQELVVEEILEDIFHHFAEQVRPVEQETEKLDLTINFQELPLQTGIQQAA